MTDTIDFRGKLLIDKSYSYKSQFVEQKPITDLLPYLEHAFANGVKAVKWNQFVPSFNDGEPCEFTIYYVCLTSNDKVAEMWVNDRSVEDNEEIYPDLDYLSEDAFEISSWGAHPDGLTDDVDVPIQRSEFEFAIRAEFGDNVTVVITPESTYKFEYDCGY